MWSMRDLTATHSLHSLTVRLLVVAAVIDFFFFFKPLFCTTTFFCNLSNCVYCCLCQSLQPPQHQQNSTYVQTQKQPSRRLFYAEKEKRKIWAKPAAGFEIGTTARRLRPPADEMDMAAFPPVSSSVASQHGQIPRTHSQTQSFLSIRPERPASSAPGPPSCAAILNRHRIHWPSRCLMPC